MDLRDELHKPRRVPQPITVVLRLASKPFTLFYKILRAVFFKVFSRRFIFGVVCVATLAALFIGEENLRGKWAWERCKRELEAQGEHMDLSAPPQIPDDQNFAMSPPVKALTDYFESWSKPQPVKPATTMGELRTDPVPPPLAALTRQFSGLSDKTPRPLEKNGGWQAGRPKDLKLWQAYFRAEFPKMAHPDSPEEDVLASSVPMDGLLAELREAARTRPLCRFPLKWELGPAMALRHLSVLQSLSKILDLRAVAELRAGRGDDAFADVQLSFRVLDLVRSEPTFISQLVRAVSVPYVIGPVWEGIRLHRWSVAQLAAIESDFRRLDFLADYKFGLRAERTQLPAIIAAAVENPRVFFSMSADVSLSKIDFLWLDSLRVLKGWGYQNAACSARLTQGMLDSIDEKKGSIEPSRVLEELARAEKMPKPPLFRQLGADLVPYFGQLRSDANGISLLAKFASMQCYANEAITACSIERYRLANGKLPATLDDLRMENPPHDVIDGGPLQYRVTGDDYLLYSIGWQEKFNGGAIAKTKSGGTNMMKSDWFWSLKPL
jgi:hypothetical protein